jgi:glycosyltransferase involved in cell wall biosynthesis
MRLAIEVSAIMTGRLSGVGYYIENLLKALLKHPGEHDWLLFTNRSDPAQIANLEAGFQLDNSCSKIRQGWMQLQLPRRLAHSRPALCHFPNYLAPLMLKQPYVLSIYDVSVWSTPWCHPPKTLAVHRALTPISAKRARLVITISESARQDIIAQLKLPPEKVRVVYGGVSPEFQPLNPAEIAPVTARYRLDAPYVLAVGTLEPRKNHRRLLAAFKEVVAQERLPHHLVLAGGAGWQATEFIEQVQESGLAGRVHLLGYVPRADLPALYGGADLFAFPSLEEGFGLPLLEAMACGTPSLISTAPALVEVARGAAAAVPATSVSELAATLYKLLVDREEARKYRELGLERAKAFSWAESAKRTIEIYQEAAAPETINYRLKSSLSEQAVN